MTVDWPKGVSTAGAFFDPTSLHRNTLPHPESTVSMSAEDALFQRFGKEFPKSTVLFREGESGKEMYVLQAGRAMAGGPRINLGC